MDLDNTTAGRIGYYIDSENYVEHPLSTERNPHLVACENEPISPWTNIIYTLSGLWGNTAYQVSIHTIGC